jgi:sec-independent protein translocase protein TatB
MNLSPQFGFFELVVVAIVALIVVGPRELPKLMRMAGQAAAKARRMANEFRSAFDQMARESEMEEMRKEIDSLKRHNALAEAKREFDAAAKPVSIALREGADDPKDAADEAARS